MAIGTTKKSLLSPHILPSFTNRLRIQLRSLGINPLMISIDDFYKEGIDSTPIDEFGKPDFEHIDSLDRELFDEVMYKLISGEEVALPKYSFKERKRTFEEPIKLANNQPIMIEGIHALNDMLTPSIDNELKFKIYIAPQAQINIDDHSPLNTTDLRLIRRIVRDMKYRNCPAAETIRMWQSVRNGEFKWIYPNQEGANFVFNSELSYELCILRTKALPALREIKPTDPEYLVANRLIKYLKYFRPIEDESMIPCNSLLREFIGGSCFRV